MAEKIDVAALDIKERLVATKSVSKTVKGGRIRRFTALMVVGDENGHVGYGLGKAAEIPDAIKKAIEDAKKNVIKVSLRGTTIPHEIVGEFGAGKVLLKPAAEGTGVIARGGQGCSGHGGSKGYQDQMPEVEQSHERRKSHFRGPSRFAHGRRGRQNERKSRLGYIDII